jgi:hypothetical protein
MTRGTVDHEELRRIAKKIRNSLRRRGGEVAVVSPYPGQFKILSPISVEFRETKPDRIVGVYAEGATQKIILEDIRESIFNC